MECPHILLRWRSSHLHIIYGCSCESTRPGTTSTSPPLLVCVFLLLMCTNNWLGHWIYVCMCVCGCRIKSFGLIARWVRKMWEEIVSSFSAKMEAQRNWFHTGTTQDDEVLNGIYMHWRKKEETDLERYMEEIMSKLIGYMLQKSRIQMVHLNWSGLIF